MSHFYQLRRRIETRKPTWIKELLKEYESEGLEESRFKLLKPKTRGVLWNMALHIGYNKNGEAGQACRILEKYFYCLFQAIHGTSTHEEKQILYNALSQRIILLIACSVQIAAKMCSARARVSPKIIRIKLIRKGFIHTIPEIIATEAEIFSRIGYKVPLQTTVQNAEHLAASFGFKGSMLEAIRIITDLTELQRNEIAERIRKATRTARLRLRAIHPLHLCAGVVAAAVYFYKIPKSPEYRKIVFVKLADLVDCSASFVCLMGKVIKSQFFCKMREI